MSEESLEVETNSKKFAEKPSDEVQAIVQSNDLDHCSVVDVAAAQKLLVDRAEGRAQEPVNVTVPEPSVATLARQDRPKNTSRVSNARICIEVGVLLGVVICCFQGLKLLDGNFYLACAIGCFATGLLLGLAIRLLFGRGDPDYVRLQLILTLPVVLACGFFFWNREKDGAKQVSAEEKAVLAVENLRGSVHRDFTKEGKPIVFVSLSFTNVKDGDLHLLTAFPELRTILLSRTDITGAGMRELARLDQLRCLVLSGARFWQDDLFYLGELQHLHTLDLSGTMVTDAVFRHLGTLTQLQELDMSNTAVTGAGLNAMVHLKQLQRLYLRATHVTDAGLEKLAECQHLESLDLTGTRMTNSGLRAVSRLRTLRKLNISRTQITDEGLRELRTLDQLRELIVWDTRATKAGMIELNDALPACRIFSSSSDSDRR